MFVAHHLPGDDCVDGALSVEPRVSSPFQAARLGPWPGSRLAPVHVTATGDVALWRTG